MCSRMYGISMRVHRQDHLSTSATGPGPRSGAMFVLDRTIYRRRRPDLGQDRVHYSKIGYLVGISARACVRSRCLLDGLAEPMSHVCFSVSSEPCQVTMFARNRIICQRQCPSMHRVDLFTIGSSTGVSARAFVGWRYSHGG